MERQGPDRHVTRRDGCGAAMKADRALIDGEIVAVDRAGHPSLQVLKHRGSHPHDAIVLYAFTWMGETWRESG